MNNQFPELTKCLAQSVTRRAALGTSCFRLPAITLAVLVFTSVGLQFPTPVAAATITVSTMSDSGAGSLRQAIQNAASGDTINFSVTGAITLTSGQLLVAKSLTIAGPGAANLAVSGNASSRIFEISSNVSVSISGLTICDGHAPNGVAAGARGTNGGGIFNAGTLALTGCAVRGNSAGNATTVFSSNFAGPPGGSGGGIYNLGNLTLTACTVSSNTAGTGGIGATGGAGGPGGAIHNAGTLVLLNSTLSGNVAGLGGRRTAGSQSPAGGDGGAIYNAGSLTVTACTISGNRAGEGGPPRIGGRGGNGGNGGGIFNAASASSAKLSSTLVGLNNPGAGGRRTTDFTQGGANGTGWDLFGPFTSRRHNLIGAPYPSTGFTNGVNADIVGPLDPLLSPLQNNGGPTFTLALLPGSPALNAGDDALLNAPFNLSTDQRGLPRKSGTHVDIGAFESQAAAKAAQQAARIALPPQLPNQPFQFTVVAQPGTAGRIEASGNLQTWTTLTNFTSDPDGNYEFIDASTLDYAHRFYRAVSP